MSILNKILKVFLGDKNEKDLKEVKPYLEKIENIANSIASLSNNELRNKTNEFKEKIKSSTLALNTQIEELKNHVTGRAKYCHLHRRA